MTADATRTSIRLADGRELIYFDDRPGVDRSAPDRRDLVAPDSDPEIRHDPILDEWVIVAAHRQGRTFLPPTSECPLCPSTPDRPTEIPAADYDVAVFQNRFPSLAEGASERPPGEPPLDRTAAVGRCEVVCFTSDHDASFAGLGPDRLATVGRALVDRSESLARIPGVEYVFAFENRGEEIGVTLHHPHGQIYGYPFVPPRVRAALRSAERHRAETGACLFCSVVEAELAAAERVVRRTDRFVAFVPAAAHWPFEVHVYPLRHVPDLAALDGDELLELLELQGDMIGRLGRLFDVPAPYIMSWLQAPVAEGRETWHLHVEIVSARRAPGKLKYLAGSESGVGAFINDIVPEDAAERLRAAG